MARSAQELHSADPGDSCTAQGLHEICFQSAPTGWRAGDPTAHLVRPRGAICISRKRGGVAVRPRRAWDALDLQFPRMMQTSSVTPPASCAGSGHASKRLPSPSRTQRATHLSTTAFPPTPT